MPVPPRWLVFTTLGLGALGGALLFAAGLTWGAVPFCFFFWLICWLLLP
jgi:hypothetical protein